MLTLFTDYRMVIPDDVNEKEFIYNNNKLELTTTKSPNNEEKKILVITKRFDWNMYIILIIFFGISSMQNKKNET